MWCNGAILNIVRLEAAAPDSESGRFAAAQLCWSKQDKPDSASNRRRAGLILSQ
jgi:hypothetical protein